MSEKTGLKVIIILVGGALLLMQMAKEPSTAPSYATTPTIPEYSGIAEARKAFERAIDASENRPAATPNWVGDAPKYYSTETTVSRPAPVTSCRTEYSGNREKDRSSWETVCK